MHTPPEIGNLKAKVLKDAVLKRKQLSIAAALILLSIKIDITSNYPLMAVLDDLIYCSVEITTVDGYLTDQKQGKVVKRVNTRSFDRPVTEQKKWLLKMLSQYVKVVKTTQ